MEEIWKPIKWASGYFVSSHGRVSGLKNTILKSTPNIKGYPTVIVYASKVRIHRTIHRIVCEAFIGDRPNGKEINHKDGVKTNNFIENLEYIDSVEHRKHTASLGRRPKGKDHWKAKLSESDVLKIRTLGWNRERKGIELKNRISTYKIAKEFKISPTHVHEILTRKSWKHI